MSFLIYGGIVTDSVPSVACEKSTMMLYQYGKKYGKIW